MPRKPSGKAKKQKLSKEERSQIAKDRWTKIKTGKAHDGDVIATITTPLSRIHFSEVGTIDPKDLERMADEAPAREPIADIFSVPKKPLAEQEPEPIPAPPPAPAPTIEVPAAQLAPVRVPKPKRYTGPKEFSGALKAAEKRLAKAINERAEAMGKLAGLNAEIPSLLQIIQALKGSNNLPPAPFDFSGGVPNATAFQAPIDPQAALMAAMAAPPVSRASGGAVQFSPEVVGSLEGPDDDDPDKFISGPHAGGGWIGA